MGRKMKEQIKLKENFNVNKNVDDGRFDQTIYDIKAPILGRLYMI